jgi:isopentenyl-diphosphate delta-isomerase
VIVKEIGAGISGEVAGRLMDVGVRFIDVAGAGGTSWAGVEGLRNRERNLALRFWDWGIPLVDALRGLARMKTSGEPLRLIASGGVSSGLDVAKCLALGADLAAAARPFLLALNRKGKRGLQHLVHTWADELRGVMFLTGSGTIAELQRAPLVIAEAP